MEKKIAILPGDGIGREVTEAAAQVLKQVETSFNHSFTFEYADIGGGAVDKYDDPLPAHTLDICKKSDAILLGAVGGPAWDHLPGEKRPEKGLLRIRKELRLFANLRPVRSFKSLLHSSPLREEVIDGVDVMIVRELTGGLYFGEPRERRTIDGEEAAVDTLVYKKSEIQRIVQQAFEIARLRTQKVISVDKANVLESSRLWRETAEETARDYPDVELEHMLVDNAAMQIMYDPKKLDVIVTENMFGDILSDEASMLTGSLGMLPSASIGSEKPALYEPVHGSAPDIAGKKIANPLATIASSAMMLKYSFGLQRESDVVEEAIEQVLLEGLLPADLSRGETSAASTDEITKAVCRHIERLALK
ncbi:3-isopropylmalate dehydrogenase [Marinococcus halophilus]|uniref:3-isopropylmalate dehydrogenase n=1 Tax=Marinococcus halophilus TaxID=1371 RepID=A0A510Y6H2_MARHA|nr:3-isopropylmalate dehydrogenase [Marinococcus halophilus]OZT80002.1 3-isopropylmalate dehydrogenase [Marinococcus halophilus]GEK58077.1 3-isopropylmalate dehydrogenase [Marinococcus halophilus]